MADAADSISVAEHLSRILADLTPQPPRPVPLADALGLVLAEDVAARVAVPGFDNSAMDGYAVHLADVAAASAQHPVVLQVVADLPAGSPDDPDLAPGQAARIMTGAAMPDAADCVVPVELTDAGLTSVTIRSAPAQRRNVRLVGSDVQVGDIALTAGRVLTSRDIAAAAAVGHSELPVHPRLRVAVISTGSELVTAGGSLARGQIHDSNSWLLAAAVAELGADPVRIATVPDDEDRLRAAFEQVAGTVDAIVTSGGVSVGAYDVVKALLSPLPTMCFGPVRMQPGKPQGFGRWLDGTPVFTLPGNPVSVFVSFETFVAPALRLLQGRTALSRPVLEGIADQGWRSPAGRAHFMPVVAVRAADGRLRVRPAARGGSGSHLVASLAGANAIAIVPEDVTEVQAGDQVAVSVVTEPHVTEPAPAD
ncbi:molybdopterin molybdotransferase MoeA [Microbacterium kribbense]|uniref:Molybdopterin molybdenumtransferase n=1 Tax=Microbacterium kribbense TaxID=433645 RepID=A0ABP7GIA5_9MICO